MKDLTLTRPTYVIITSYASRFKYLQHIIMEQILKKRFSNKKNPDIKQLPDREFGEYVADYCSSIEVDKLADSPKLAWKTVRDKFRVSGIKPLPEPTPISPDKIRFVCLSDTHSQIEGSMVTIPDGDVLLHAGDFCSAGAPREVSKFNTFLGKLPHKYKVVIAGNHDRCFEADGSRRSLKLQKQCLHPSSKEEFSSYGLTVAQQLLSNCIYLQDSMVKISGINIYGSPWQPHHYGWAFNLERGCSLLNKWDQIPDETDILMTHGPPLGFGDLLTGGYRAGCVDLLNTIQKRVRPKYHVCGHIHEGYGIKTDGYTVYINASTCTRFNKPLNPPIVFDFPLPDGHTKDENPLI
ncbi:hypothetical protein ScPMuIL_012480 [Solemya velum]